MDKLLLVVMSLALGAILLVSGAYYGNAAYQDAKAEAQAQQIVNQMLTIANAWKQWSKDKGGVTALSDYNWTDGTATDLVPNYLSAFIKPPSAFQSSCSLNYTPIKSYSFQTSSCISTGPSNDSISLIMAKSEGKSKRICEKIAELSRGKGAAVLVCTSCGVDLASLMVNNTTVDCIDRGSAYSSYAVLYRIFK